MADSIPSSIYEFTLPDIRGQALSLDSFRGQVVLIVNVASRCVFTSQYEPLQLLYDKYREQGFTILGFPCNQFAAQESKSNEEIQSFCSLTYNVTFPMFAKIEVNGTQTHPLYAYLKKNALGLLGSESIKWNFTKFLVDREGHVVSRFSPSTSPSSLEHQIEALLG